jgi:hypothetical protein
VSRRRPSHRSTRSEHHRPPRWRRPPPRGRTRPPLLRCRCRPTHPRRRSSRQPSSPIPRQGRPTPSWRPRLRSCLRRRKQRRPIDRRPPSRCRVSPRSPRRRAWRLPVWTRARAARAVVELARLPRPRQHVAARHAACDPPRPCWPAAARRRCTHPLHPPACRQAQPAPPRLRPRPRRRLSAWTPVAAAQGAAARGVVATVAAVPRPGPARRRGPSRAPTNLLRRRARRRARPHRVRCLRPLSSHPRYCTHRRPPPWCPWPRKPRHRGRGRRWCACTRQSCSSW